MNRKIIRGILEEEKKLARENEVLIKPSTIIAWVIAFLYFLSPIDIFPEGIVQPKAFGFIDDIFVVGGIIVLTYEDIRKVANKNVCKDDGCNRESMGMVDTTDSRANSVRNNGVNGVVDNDSSVDPNIIHNDQQYNNSDTGNVAGVGSDSKSERNDSGDTVTESISTEPLYDDTSGDTTSTELYDYWTKFSGDE